MDSSVLTEHPWATLAIPYDGAGHPISARVPVTPLADPGTLFPLDPAPVGRVRQRPAG